MKGTIGLLGSKRGVWCLFMALLSLVLVFTGYITGAQWIDFAKFITGFLVVGHTASSLADRMAKHPLPVATAQPSTSGDAKPPA